MIHIVFKKKIYQIIRGRTYDYKILRTADETA